MTYNPTRHIDGDVSVGRNVAVGGEATVRGSLSVAHHLHVEGWLDARNIKGVNKGLYLTAEKLRTVYPNPRNGWWAIVVELPEGCERGDCMGQVYLAQNGEWIALTDNDAPQLGGNPILDSTDIIEYLEEVKAAIDEHCKNSDLERLNATITAHQKEADDYRAATDAKLWALSTGAEAKLSAIPPVVYKGVETNVTLTASVNIADVDSLTIYSGYEPLASNTGSRLLMKPISINTQSDLDYKATAVYKGLELSAAVTVYARNPIYAGFVTGVNDVPSPSHKLSARTSATGTYRAVSPADGMRYRLLVPVDVPALSSFTMGGAPYVMVQPDAIAIGNVSYRVYISGSVYNAGSEIDITAK